MKEGEKLEEPRVKGKGRQEFMEAFVGMLRGKKLRTLPHNFYGTGAKEKNFHPFFIIN